MQVCCPQFLPAAICSTAFILLEQGEWISCSTHGVVILPLLFKGSCPARKYFADQLLEQRDLTSSVVSPGITGDPAQDLGNGQISQAFAAIWGLTIAF